MSAQHTPEPWKLIHDDLLLPEIIAGEKVIIPALRPNADADMRRIVACVNACAGTTTDDLNRIADFGGWEKLSITWKTDREQLEQQHEVRLGEKIQLTQVLNARLEGMQIENDLLKQQRNELLAAVAEWAANPTTGNEFKLKAIAKVGAA